MQVITCDLPRSLTKAEIEVFADLHIGDNHCDMKLIRERIQRVAENDHVYCILNGDLMNNATKTSVSDIYTEDIPPMEQIKRCIELFGPIKDKILCITSGNHEKRTDKKENIDLTEVMAMQLGLQDKFSKGACLLFLRLGDKGKHGHNTQMRYVIYALHGSGGGRKEGAKATKLADMAGIVDADIYIHSHTHLPMVIKQAFYRTDTRNSTVNLVTKLFVNTSAMLDYGGYGEEYEFKPSAKDCPIIHISGTKREMIARL